MVTTNPIHNYSPLISLYKVRVTLVYDWGRDCNFAENQTIKDFCASNNIAFAARGFDTYKYFEDREYVAKLPAFQVYVLDDYERTVYPGTDAIQELQAVILGIRIMDAEKKRQKEVREQRLQILWSYLTWNFTNKSKAKEQIKSRRGSKIFG
jgi:hypothetical protein